MTGGDWYDPSGNPITMPIDLAIAVDGAYQYEIDSAGCALSAFINLTIPHVDIIPVITDATCHTVCDGTVNVAAVGALSFSIDNGVTFQNTGLFTGLCDSTYIIVVATELNGGGCLFDSTITISEPDPVVITSISLADTICIGGTSNLMVTAVGGSNGAYDYAWDNGIILDLANVSISPANSVTVCVIVSDEDCPNPPNSTPADTACTTVTIPASIELTIPEFPDGCYPHKFGLGNTSSSLGNVTSINPLSTVESSTWTFSDGAAYSNVNANDSVFHEIENPGSYDVTLSVVSNDFGCVYTETFFSEVIVHDRPKAKFSYAPAPLDIFNTVARFNDLSEGDAVQWLWKFSGGPTPSTSPNEDPQIKYPEGVPGIFPMELTVWNQYGCDHTVEGIVEIINDVNVFAPNVFTPDGDDLNNTWRVYISGVDVYDFHLIVFNRWGEKVFESFDPNAEWDGSYSGAGNVVQEGSYVWVIDAKDLKTDKRYDFRGAFSILK